MIKKFLTFVGEYRRYAFAPPLLMVGEVTLEIFIPFLMARIIDHGILGNGGIQYTAKIGTVMVLMACVSLSLGALAGRFAAKAGTGFAANLRRGLFNKVQEFSFSNADKFSTASLITRHTTDVTNIQNAFMMLLRVGFRAPLMLIGATIMAVRINGQLAIIFFAAIPILATALYFIGSTAHPRFRAMFKKYDAMNATVQENLIGIRVVKAFVREAYEEKKFQENASMLKNAQLFAEKVVILNMPLLQITMYLSILSILWFGGNLVGKEVMGVGQLAGFISYVSQILMSLMMISMIFIVLLISRASAVRIIEILDEVPDIQDTHTDSNQLPPNGSIEFQHVSFKYSPDAENFVLNDISFSIRSGERVGIIGGTGSAKSTLVQLIPRLYEATKGKILVGGNTIEHYSIHKLRSTIAIVLQNSLLFSGTIRENLLWGNPNASEQEVIKASKIAQAHSFIDSFPYKYDTMLGQGGVNLSGGQKQRLAIARALLKKPKILILDDATSAIDTVTDSKFRAGLKEFSSDTTILMIAQRISSVQDADTIILLEKGKINGIGSHEELLATNRIYREVCESQEERIQCHVGPHA